MNMNSIMISQFQWANIISNIIKLTLNKIFRMAMQSGLVLTEYVQCIKLVLKYKCISIFAGIILIIIHSCIYETDAIFSGKKPSIRIKCLVLFMKLAITYLLHFPQFFFTIPILIFRSYIIRHLLGRPLMEI